MKRLAWIFLVLVLALPTGCKRNRSNAVALSEEEQQKKIAEQDKRVEEAESRGGGSYDYGVKELDRKIEEAERKK